MALLDVAAQNASLDNDYGADKDPNSPATLELALFNDDPANGGVEMDAAGGYAPVSMNNDGTNFPAAADGQKMCAVQTFPTSTGEWTAGGVADVATYWALRDPATGVIWDTGELASDISVEAAGTDVSVQPIIFYNGGLQ